MGNNNSKTTTKVNPDTVQESMENMKKFFRNSFPKYLLEGPYHSATKVTLSIIFILLIIIRSRVGQLTGIKSINTNDSIFESLNTLKLIKLVASIYGLSVMGLMIKYIGFFPFASYTIVSWNLTTFRFLFGFLALQFKSEMFHSLSETLRFPSMVQNTVTFFIWWFVLAPIISAFIYMKNRKSKEKAIKEVLGFVNWNFSPFLLTVHGLNLPFAFLGHLIEPRALQSTDLYFGISSAAFYLAFYLGVLDRNGVPLYIILSPRSIVGPISYISLLSLYVYIHSSINSVTPGLVDNLRFVLENYFNFNG